MLCEWRCKFISEACKSDGTEYTPHSLYLLLTGIQRKIRSNHPTEAISFFHDAVFKPLRMCVILCLNGYTKRELEQKRRLLWLYLTQKRSNSGILELLVLLTQLLC